MSHARRTTVARQVTMARWLPLVFAFAGWSCVPSLELDESVIDETRLIAVTSEPAEPAPGEPVTWTAWFASSDGEQVSPHVSWDFCLRRPPLAQAGTVDLDCLEAIEGAFIKAGYGTTLATVVPIDACSRFGPDPPPVEAGETAGRAAIPDSTGGYQQAVIARWDAGSGRTATTVAQRIRCGLAGATQAESAEFRRSYIPNTNPGGLELLVFDDAGQQLTPDATGETVLRPGQRVDLVLRWPGCSPGTPCSGREYFVRFDSDSRSIVQQRESMRVQWLASTPGFRAARTGIGPLDDGPDEVVNSFEAPTNAGMVYVWVIARDGRGGSAVLRSGLRVEAGN